MAGKSFAPTLEVKPTSELRHLHLGESRGVPSAFLDAVRAVHGEVIVASSDGIVIRGDELFNVAVKMNLSHVPCVIVPSELTIPSDWQQLPTSGQ